MSLIQWRSDFSVEYPPIDEQHKKLVGLLNTLYEAMREGKGSKELGTILSELTDYTNYHFSYEEQIMEKFNYADRTKHKQIHKELIDQVLQYKEEFESGKALVSVKMLDFLKDWLSNHILQVDMQLKPIFQKANDK